MLTASPSQSRAEAMMQEAVSGSDILANVRKNEYRRWFSQEGDKSTAASRFASGELFPIGHRPKFQLSHDEAIFTIGSCFARNIENKLVQEGINLLLKGHGVPHERYASFDGKDPSKNPKALMRGALNKYSTHSISNEVHRTLLGLEYPNEGLIELAENQWFDPHASSLKLDTFEVCVDTRRHVAAAMATIREATTVFMTLGLTETWLDRETGLVLNVPPVPLYIKKFGERFAFFNASYPDTLEALENTIALIREKCRADMKFVVTVSPVSLFSTYTQMDVVMANTYSKSVLRTVAQTVANKYPFVDYYPSFEMIMNSPRMTTWEKDQHHVDAKAVDGVVTRFVELYFD
jgi:hypothetical protein